MSLIGVNISCGLTVRCVVARCDYSAYCDGLIVRATTPKGRSTPLEVRSDSEDLAEQGETKRVAKGTAWVKAAGRRKLLSQRATSPMRISRSRKPSTSGGCVTLTAPPPPRCFEERVV
jgi:hypothetical protein